MQIDTYKSQFLLVASVSKLVSSSISAVARVLDSSFANIFISILALLLLNACSDKVQTNQQDSNIHAYTVNELQSILKGSTNNSNFLNEASAHWLTSEILVLTKTDKQLEYQLIIKDKNKQVVNTISLNAVSFPAQLAKTFPHLARFQAYKVDLSSSNAKLWLKQQLMVIGLDKNQDLKQLAYVQTAAVLDALYTSGDNDADEVIDLGATIGKDDVSFKLWAPTAQKIEVLLFNDDLTPAKPSYLTMVEDVNTGVWSASGNIDNNTYYQYKITVYHPESKKVETLITTDPYSLSLSVNSQYSQVVDLNSNDTQPENWQNHQIPTVKNIEDNIFYETHIRDFSSDDTALSNDKYRGKYKAFSEQNSYGIKHLKALKVAGLNNIHLLPTYDLASINEDANSTIDINDPVTQVKAKVCDKAPNITICTADYAEEQSLKLLLTSLSSDKSTNADGEQVQKIVSELRQFDNFNWGYDPFHYTVPEGSYAINPKGKSRLVEFREMVQSLHGLGFRVIMDVVYNHTYQFGLKEKSVLDKIVPNYYHRLSITTGEVEQSTCFTCGNTATERVMMAKLMIDSLVVWSRDHKIDGFRFDLMGHQTKASMLAARDAVRIVDPDTYFYGEGWNFGEVANNSRFVQASQLELGGSEIGTYSDRLRDAVRGGGNNTRDSQGLGNGLLLMPNDMQNGKNGMQEYQLRMDQLRVGLAGNLANFPIYQENDKPVLGKDIPYGDQPTGYALDPADTINYVSKHDNQTLWDNSQYRLPYSVSTDDRVRMHLQSLSFTLFAQGIPFIHMGSEFMRSKSFLRDSYDYGDWFNRVDFSKQNNYYNVGLPPADKDKGNWPLIKTVIKGHQNRDQVSAKQIKLSSQIFENMIALRMSSPLFRLTTANDIIDKVSFLNTPNSLNRSHSSNAKDEQLGLLVMKLDDTQGKPVDEKVKSLIVIFNSNSKTQTFLYWDANKYQLHPIQKNGADAVIKQSEATDNGFTVPALSSAVFVKYLL